MRRPLQSPALINAFYDSLRPEQRETCMAMQRAILSGDMNPTMAFMTGKLSVDGSMGLAMKLGSALS